MQSVIPMKQVTLLFGLLLSFLILAGGYNLVREGLARTLHGRGTTARHPDRAGLVRGGVGLLLLGVLAVSAYTFLQLRLGGDTYQGSRPGGSGQAHMTPVPTQQGGEAAAPVDTSGGAREALWVIVTAVATFTMAVATAYYAYQSKQLANLAEKQLRGQMAPFVEFRSDFEAEEFETPDEDHDKKAKVSLVNDGNGIALNVRAWYVLESSSQSSKVEAASTIAVGGTHSMKEGHPWRKDLKEKREGPEMVSIEYTDAAGHLYYSIRDAERHWTRGEGPIPEPPDTAEDSGAAADPA